MSRVMIVAWREFKQTVMRPIFLIAILGLPFLMVGIGAVAVLIMIAHKEPPLIGTIAVIAPTDEIVHAGQVEFDQARIAADEAKEQAENAEKAMKGGPMGAGTNSVAQRGEVRVTIESAQATHDDLKAIELLKQQVRQGNLLGYAEFPEEIFASSTDKSSKAERAKFTLFVNENIDTDNVRLIQRRLAKATVRVRAERAGLSGDQAIAMVREPEAETTRAKPGGGETVGNEERQEIRAHIIPMVFMMLIWIGTISSAQHLMMSTIEEKSNKVMEVLLSAVSPLQLMTGKILGYGAVGLLIVGVYSSLGIGALIALAAVSDYIQWVHLVYLGVFYIMAYSMIACIMAAVGSAVSDVREANTLITPVMLVLMVPLMLWMPISQSPNGPVAIACSFIPPAIPFAMILRIVSEEGVPLWQILLSIVWGYACVMAMVWFAARVFRVGVLMTGKPPTPLELIRWARYK